MAVVGVGQTLCGDDGAGPAVINQLRRILPINDRLLIIDAGHAPENVLGVIIRFKPEIVLFVDAVRMDVEPGRIIILSSSQAEEAGGSTHTLPLSMLASYISSETKAQTQIVGIQPAVIGFGDSLSTPVQKAVGRVADLIKNYWRNAAADCSAISAGEISEVST